MSRGKGWYDEPQRHSLASRGIRTRAVLDPRSGRPISPNPKELRRYVGSIDALGNMLGSGIVRECGWNGYYGGLTTARNLEDAFGNIIVEFNPNVMFEINNLYRVEYTREFIEEFPEIEGMVLGHTEVDEYTDCALEEEMFSTDPIRFTPDAVKEIIIRYGEEAYSTYKGKVEDPISHILVDEDDPERFNKIKKSIERGIIKYVPLEYHSKIRLEWIG